MMTKRNNSLDLLRVISTIAVIMIHINWNYFGPISESYQWSFHYAIESLINIVTRFSVPAFVMISGYFNLKDQKNMNVSYFYKKTFIKIGLPVIVVITLFAITDLFDIQHRGTTLVPALQSILNGTYYNLWFVYMIFGCYFLTPVILAFKEKTSYRTYKMFVIISLFWAFLSQATSSQSYSYSIGVVGAFITYYMYGDLVRIELEKRRKKRIKDNNLKYFLISLLCIALTFYSRWKGNSYYLSAAFTNFFSPTIMIYSICVFKSFVNLNIKANWSRLSNLTFYIYLFHTWIYLWIFTWIDRVIHFKPIFMIMIVTALTFTLSWLVSMIYNWLWNKGKKLLA